MKFARLRIVTCASVILLFAPLAIRAQSSSDDSGAKQSMKNAGNDTRDAAHQAGTGIKQGTRKGYHKTKSGTDKAYHKTKHGTKRAVHKVEGTPDTRTNNPPQ